MKKFNIKLNSPIFIGEYPFHQQLSDELVPVLEEYPDLQDRGTNVKAVMTDWDFDLVPKSLQIKKFKLYLTNTITKEFEYHLVGQSQPPIKLVDFWANVYREGDYTESHNHWPFSEFSFAYFLKSEWYYSPLVFTDSGVRIRPKAGKFVIFNSLIKHHVPKHRFKKSRITLSGNCRVLEQGGIEA